MLSAPFARIFSLITFNHFTLIQNHVLFFNTFVMMFWTLREKIIIPDLCEDMMNYFYEASFTKNNKVLLLETREQSVQMKKKNDLCLHKPEWIFPMVQDLVSLFPFVFFFIFMLLCISSWTDSGRSNILQESLFSYFQSDFNLYGKG